MPELSWSFTQTLAEAVADMAAATVPTPGFDPSLADESKLGLTVGSTVLDVPDQATIEFGDGDATVTNKSGAEWPASSSLYIYAPRKIPDVDDVKDAFVEAQDAISGLKTQVNDLETQVNELKMQVEQLQTGETELEEDIASLDARVSALENVQVPAPETESASSEPRAAPKTASTHTKKGKSRR